LLDGAGLHLRQHAPGCRLVSVAYADYQVAGAPPLDDVLERALACREGPFLVDTYGKDGSTLLDLLSLSRIADLCRRCRRAGVPIALAGSLGPREIERLRPAEPTWFAVRGAACRGRDRQAAVDSQKVRELVELINRAG
jgi:uncharacterized protein (UPF0264 family)